MTRREKAGQMTGMVGKWKKSGLHYLTDSLGQKTNQSEYQYHFLEIVHHLHTNQTIQYPESQTSQVQVCAFLRYQVCSFSWS